MEEGKEGVKGGVEEEEGEERKRWSRESRRVEND